MASPKTHDRISRSQKPTSNRGIVSLKDITTKHQSISSLLPKQLRGLILGANPSQTQKLNCRRCKTKNRPPIALILAVVSLTSSMGHRFYNQPKLDVGTIAPATIVAPQDAKVEDTKTTEAKRKAARWGLIPVLMADPIVNLQIYQQLQQYIDQVNGARQIAGPFPYAKTSVLSISTQIYLRGCQEWEWRTILAELDGELTDKSVEKSGASPSTASPFVSTSPQLQRALRELQAYRRSSSASNLSALLSSISQVRLRYVQSLAMLSNTDVWKRGTLQDASVLDLSEADWQNTRTGILQAAERILTQGIPPGLPTLLKHQAVSMHVKILVPEIAQPLATQLLISVLRPNLKEDIEQTRLQAEQAAQDVKPEIVEVRRGEVIVAVGEEISQRDFVLLDYFGLSARGINWLSLIGCGVLVSGAVSVFWLVERRFHPGLRQRDHILVLMMTLSAPLLASFGVPYTNLPAIGILLGTFYGSALGVTSVVLLALGLPVGMEIAWEHLLTSAVGGIIAALIAGRLRSREELALLGIGVGLTEGAVYLILNLIVSAVAGSIWYTVLQEAALYSLTGVAWSVVALGLSPYLEHLFDLVTPIRLAELANPNRPLLKRLAEEAPGTFQHTLFVATLAEAAAKALGCNVELVRTGTLYHDIGKLHDPQGFIENQMGGPNKHDEINDPYKSASIIKKHVTEGLVMARRYRVPNAIQAFIPEHQGTMLIAYFYYQAQQDPNRPLEESYFRYDGPIPQTRETAIVMLADSCEAALRSLKDATYEEALAMVNKILKARWQDKQLVDSGLTRQEMSQIGEIFVQVWQQFHHKRIAYPKAALSK